MMAQFSMTAACSVVFIFCISGLHALTHSVPPASIPSGTDSEDDSSAFGSRGKGPWDLRRVFADRPPGAYADFMLPLVYANYLTYKTSPGPKFDVFLNPKTATIPEEFSGGRQWERLHEVEKDPQLGPYMRAFVDHSDRRAILAFRGMCYDEFFPSCRSDMHMGKNGNPSFNDYLEMATRLVVNAKKHLSREAFDYAILVTGHSLGADFASWACKRSTVECQVVGLAGGLTSPGPPPKDSFVLFDPIDLGIPVRLRSYDKIGYKTLCVFNVAPPRSCKQCVDQSPVVRATQYLEYQKCKNFAPIPLGHYEPLCREDTHWLDHWIADIIPRPEMGKPTVLPNCSEFSTVVPAGAPMVAK